MQETGPLHCTPHGSGVQCNSTRSYNFLTTNEVDEVRDGQCREDNVDDGGDDFEELWAAVFNEVGNESGEVSIDCFPVNVLLVPLDSVSFAMDGSVKVEVSVQVGDVPTVGDQVDVDLEGQSSDRELENVGGQLGASRSIQSSCLSRDGQVDDGLSQNVGGDGSSLDRGVSLQGQGEGVEHQGVGQGVKSLNNAIEDGDFPLGIFVGVVSKVDVGVVQLEGALNWGDKVVGTESLDVAHDLACNSILDDSDVFRAQAGRAGDGDASCDEE